MSRVCLLAVSKKQQVTDVCARPLFAAQDQKKVKFSPERKIRPKINISQSGELASANRVAPGLTIN